MKLPERINGRWLDSLTDIQIGKVEKQLATIFRKRQKEEKAIRGASYDLTRGSAPLTAAWNHWSMVRANAEARGLRLNWQTR